MDKYLKKMKIKLRFKEDVELHEILLDRLAQKKEKEIGISEKKFEVPLSKKILKGILVLFLFLILLFFGKTFKLQVLEGEKFSVLAEANKFVIYQIKAERGVIYDQDLNQLVFNQPSFDLVLNKKELLPEESEKFKILKEISKIVKKDFEILKKEIEESNLDKVLISQNLEHQTLIILETKIAADEFPGFQIENNTVRDYKNGQNFSHLLGYTGKIRTEELKNSPESYSIFDYVGRDGLEKAYEEILRKNPGKLRVIRDALGNIISKEIIFLPESGKSLILWLDSDLQKKTKEELEKKVQEMGARGAAAVALDPKTGGVLALVSLPSFDNNIFSSREEKKIQELLSDPKESLFNRAISGGYLTGSTIKPLIALAALEEKIISPEKKIDAQGKIVVQDLWNPEKIWEFKDWAIHGLTDMRKAIAQSVNVYFYHIGGGYKDQKGLGPTKIKEYLEKFGWNQKTGIDLPGEREGFIPDKEWKRRVLGEGWWDGNTYYLSIGQQYLQITPLEVAVSFLPIANGGKFLKPQVVQKIVDSQKNLIEEFQPVILKDYNSSFTRGAGSEGEAGGAPNFIDPENLKVVREGMKWAVTGQNSPSASAILLNSLPVSAAAKTGTAQIGGDYYHNWITVFAPYEDPQIVLTIVLEKIRGEQVAALPVAKEVLEWYFSK